MIYINRQLCFGQIVSLWNQINNIHVIPFHQFVWKVPNGTMLNSVSLYTTKFQVLVFNDVEVTFFVRTSVWLVRAIILDIINRLIFSYSFILSIYWSMFITLLIACQFFYCYQGINFFHLWRSLINVKEIVFDSAIITSTKSNID